MKPKRTYAQPPAPICGACRCFTMRGVERYRNMYARLCGNCDADLRRDVDSVVQAVANEVSKAITAMMEAA